MIHGHAVPLVSPVASLGHIVLWWFFQSSCRIFLNLQDIWKISLHFLSLTIRTPLVLCVFHVGIGLLHGSNPPGFVLMHSCKTIGLMNIVRQKFEKRWQGGHTAGATWVLQRSKRKGAKCVVRAALQCRHLTMHTAACMENYMGTGIFGFISWGKILIEILFFVK